MQVQSSSDPGTLTRGVLHIVSLHIFECAYIRNSRRNGSRLSSGPDIQLSDSSGSRTKETTQLARSGHTFGKHEADSTPGSPATYMGFSESSGSPVTVSSFPSTVSSPGQPQTPSPRFTFPRRFGTRADDSHRQYNADQALDLEAQDGKMGVQFSKVGF